MISVTTSSPEQTRSMAAALADLARAGDLIVLAGDLGAGKTAFVQGFAAAIGVTGPVTSPTFTLANRYDGRLTVNHLDVYRLDNVAEVADLDLPELMDGNSVTLIEWGDAIVSVLPPDYLEIAMTLGDGDDDRNLAIRAIGPTWSARQRSMTEALAAWTGDTTC